MECLKMDCEEISSRIVVSSGKDISKALDKADDLIDELTFDRKNALHAKLIFEETLGMLKKMTSYYEAVVWLEKYSDNYCLKLTVKTEMDYNMKREFIDFSSDKKNNSITGFMDRVGDIIQNGLLSCKIADDLRQEYGAQITNYNMLGMDGTIEEMPDLGMTWTLDDYRNNLENTGGSEVGIGEAFDELEKSIVANIASNVLVGVKGDRVDMSIICEI